MVVLKSFTVNGSLTTDFTIPNFSPSCENCHHFSFFPFFPCLIFCLVLLFLRDKFIATITHLVIKKVYNSKFSVSTMNPVFFFSPLNDDGSAVKTRELQQEEAELVFGTLNYKCSFNNSNVESLCKNISLVCCKYPTCIIKVKTENCPRNQGHFTDQKALLHFVAEEATDKYTQRN